jgi:hypothetical protein
MDCAAAGSNGKTAKRPKSGKSENSQFFSPVLRHLILHFWKAEKWIRQNPESFEG